MAFIRINMCPSPVVHNRFSPRPNDDLNQRRQVNRLPTTTKETVDFINKVAWPSGAYDAATWPGNMVSNDLAKSMPSKPAAKQLL
eukprot:scaffold182305_cov46-Prasinocladus_malaysianus.AAC.2